MNMFSNITINNVASFFFFFPKGEGTISNRILQSFSKYYNLYLLQATNNSDILNDMFILYHHYWHYQLLIFIHLRKLIIKHKDLIMIQSMLPFHYFRDDKLFSYKTENA